MIDKIYIPLPGRGLIRIAGPDARDYLQGLVSQDMRRVAADTAVYSAFLTPQGKFMFDFFCFEMDGALVLDCEAARRSDFFKRLSMYKLRSDVQLSDVTDAFQVHAVPDGLDLPAERGQAAPFGAGVAYRDPRHAGAGWRVVLPSGDTAALEAAGLVPGAIKDYERLRLSLALPDGARDMSVDKALLLENGFEELDGVSFGKGCFMGQELTARTRYRGLVKKRLLAVDIDGPVPAPGTPIEKDGKDAGEMKSAIDGVGVALMRLDALEDGGTYACGDATLTVRVPSWVVFQERGGDA
ncbi:MAG: folate-binding protein YgfZ [Alphaproteobacteria bacterium]|nr:folate-binding protein YgfZ [Alphaproteobacteria bacterium]MBF0251268.1 folate-binding protein YgfZ [Alphaproteobacteria bacterium]